MPHAQIRHRFDVRRNAENIAQYVLVKNAHPAHPQPFRPRRQPQILYCTDHAVDIHARDMGAPEHHRAITAAVAGDAQIERCLENAFELELAIGVTALGVEHLRRFIMRTTKIGMNACPHFRRADDDKIPRLHEAHRRRMVRCHQHSRQLLVGHRLREKLAAHITPGVNGTIHRCALGLIKLGRTLKTCRTLLNLVAHSPFLICRHLVHRAASHIHADAGFHTDRCRWQPTH